LWRKFPPGEGAVTIGLRNTINAADHLVRNPEPAAQTRGQPANPAARLIIASAAFDTSSTAQ
jgi:hypothetical protein